MSQCLLIRGGCLIGGGTHDAGVEAVLRAVYGPKVCAPPFAAVVKVVGAIGIPFVCFSIGGIAEQPTAEVKEVLAGFSGGMSESRRVGRVEKGVAEGSIGGVGAVGIGFTVVVEEAAGLAALSAYDEAVEPQIELIAVESFGTDFAPHIGLQAEKSGKRGRGGQSVFGRTFCGLSVTLGDNGLKGVVGGLQVIFAAFGFAVGSSGVGELLEIEYAAERVKAAYIGTELMMLPFGQAGMGKGFEVAESHIGAFRRRRGRHQLNVKKPERYCTVPVFNEAHKLFTQTQTGNQFAVGVGFGAA